MTEAPSITSDVAANVLQEKASFRSKHPPESQLLRVQRSGSLEDEYILPSFSSPPTQSLPLASSSPDGMLRKLRTLFGRSQAFW